MPVYPINPNFMKITPISYDAGKAFRTGLSAKQGILSNKLLAQELEQKAQEQASEEQLRNALARAVATDTFQQRGELPPAALSELAKLPGWLNALKELQDFNAERGRQKKLEFTMKKMQSEITDQQRDAVRKTMLRALRGIDFDADDATFRKQLNIASSHAEKEITTSDLDPKVKKWALQMINASKGMVDRKFVKTYMDGLMSVDEALKVKKLKEKPKPTKWVPTTKEEALEFEKAKRTPEKPAKPAKIGSKEREQIEEQISSLEDDLFSEGWSFGLISGGKGKFDLEKAKTLTKLYQLRDQYYKQRGVKNFTPSLPPLDLLEEGKIKVFSNGQAWTLIDGIPIRVPPKPTTEEGK